MAVQQMTTSRGANVVEARTVRRLTAFVIAVGIEAILIVAVLLSTIGASPAYHPTPAGARIAPMPLPTAVR